MEKGTQAHGIKVGVRIIVLDPLQASWVRKFYNKMQNETDIIFTNGNDPK